MADLGPQIVTAATAVVSFSAGLAVEALRHRSERKARHQDERVSIYGRYLSMLRRMPTELSAVLYRSEPFDKIMARGREAEQLVGPMRLYANDEVLEVLEEVNEALFHEVALELHEAGADPSTAVTRAWTTEMREPVERLEGAMRRHLDLEPERWWRQRR